VGTNKGAFHLHTSYLFIAGTNEQEGEAPISLQHFLHPILISFSALADRIIMSTSSIGEIEEVSNAEEEPKKEKKAVEFLEPGVSRIEQSGNTRAVCSGLSCPIVAI